MMTQTQANINSYPPIHVVYPFPHDENSPSPPTAAAVEPVCDFMPEGESVARHSKKDEGPCQATSARPLWLSLTGIRSDYPWGEEVKQALKYRSVFICAAMMSVAALGVMLAI